LKTTEHDDPPLTVRVGTTDGHDKNQPTGFFIEDGGSDMAKDKQRGDVATDPMIMAVLTVYR
jgi:hypothetical protein